MIRRKNAAMQLIEEMVRKLGDSDAIVRHEAAEAPDKIDRKLYDKASAFFLEG
ncbi:MAG: hypothetical protein AB1779_02725 [Candidatus Thermoplasmatota archaeon]